MNCYEYYGTPLSFAEMLLFERFTSGDAIALFNDISGPKVSKIEDLTLQSHRAAVKLAQEIYASIQKLISEDHEKQSQARSCLGFNSIVDMFQLDSLDMIDEANALHAEIWTAIKMMQMKDNTAEDIGFLHGLVSKVGQKLWEKEAETTDEDVTANYGYLLGISAFNRLIKERSAKPDANAKADQGVWSLTDDIMSGRPELAYLVFAGLDAVLMMQQQAVYEWYQMQQYQMQYSQMAIPDVSAQDQVPVENAFPSMDGGYELQASPLVGAAQPLSVV